MEDLKTMDGKTNSKLVVTFKGRKKSLVMNRTNYDAVADIHGEETNHGPERPSSFTRPAPAWRQNDGMHSRPRHVQTNLQRRGAILSNHGGG